MPVLSIRTRLILVIGAILVAGFLATNVISFRVSSEALKTTIVQNELPLTSHAIYSEIQTDLLRPIFVSSLMSNDTFLKDWIIAGEQDPLVVRRYLDEIRSQYGVFTSFFISDRTLNYYHFSGVSRQVKTDDPQDSWFFRVRDMKAPYEINVDFNIEQGRTVTIFINYRVLDYDGKFLGVTGVGLQLDTVAEIISRYRDNYRHNIYFVAGNGDVTVRSSGAAVRERNIRNAPGMASVANEILSRDSGYFEYVRDGETMLITTRLIPELGWRVIVEQRESDAMAALRRSFLTNLAIGIAIVLATLLVVGYAVSIYHRQLDALAVTDKLTGIGNRQLFDRELERALSRGRRGNDGFSIILLDLDHFKSVNDAHGHLRGDVAIRRVAEVLRERMRAHDLLCRWGGEELAVLARGCALGDAVTLADKLRNAVAEAPLFEPDNGARVTLSAGVTENKSGDSADAVMGRADYALYRAKAGGRNRVEAAF
jgi:diguanylate cyclase (GGDEF)-like protein